MKLKLSRSSGMVLDLKKLRSWGWDDAIIAGGAIRDSAFDKPVSDVDIFLSFNDRDETSGITKDYKNTKWLGYWFDKLGANKSTDHATYIGGSSSLGDMNTNLLAAWEVEKNETKYQIMLLDKNPELFVEEDFDFGICKAFCDGTKVRFTDKFIKDALNHTITIYPEHLTEKQIEFAINHHIQKILKKYPGWTPELDALNR